jgi:enterochelin esterase-like enzyme
MKKLITILFISLSISTFAQNMGKVIEGKSMASAILKKDVRYMVYLPADYGTTERTYPVVYLLHGYSDDETGWVQFGEVNRYADKAIADGTIPPMIIVMPDGGTTWYMNAYDGQASYEDFFIKEFMPKIEKDFRIKATKKYRGLSGLSMGGFGTLNLGLRNIDLFSSIAPLSAAVFGDSDVEKSPDERYDSMFGQLYGRKLKGKDRLSKTWYENSILKIVETKSADDLKKLRYWIDCGDDDFLTKGNCLLHIALSEKGVPHEFRVREGSHNWTYWRTGITDALQFIGESFRQK